MFCSFFFNDTATTEIYTLSLHDALPILDMFLGDLFGLVLAEVSFETDEELDNFPKPPFALADVTNDPLFSGGRLCELTFQDVREAVGKAGLITSTSA